MQGTLFAPVSVGVNRPRAHHSCAARRRCQLQPSPQRVLQLLPPRHSRRRHRGAHSAAATAATLPLPPPPTNLGRYAATTVAISTLACLFLAPASLAVTPFARAAVAASFGGVVAAGGLAKGALSPAGAVAGCAVGVATMLSGPPFAAALLSFFVSSSRWTAFGAARKAAVEANYVPGAGRRSAGQVLANAGVPTLCAAALASWRAWGTRDATSALGATLAVATTSGAAFPPALLCQALSAAALAYYACCCGDTWASEIGVMSRVPPIMITTLKPVPPGTNGGVSMLGTAASCAGGLFVGAAFGAATLLLPLSSHPLFPPPLAACLLGLAAGFGGSMIDSLLGATVQYSGVDEATGKVYNKPKPGLNLTKTGGIDVVTNSAVNFISATASAVAAAAAWALLLSR